MLISTKHLRDAGLHVSVRRNGVDTKDEIQVELEFMGGSPLPTEFHDEIEARVGPEFSEALIEGFMHKIHGIQMVEAIRKTENKAWRDRNRKA